MDAYAWEGEETANTGYRVYDNGLVEVYEGSNNRVFRKREAQNVRARLQTCQDGALLDTLVRRMLGGKHGQSNR